VDHARQRQLDCADRQLDHNRNSDLSPYFDSKPGVQTGCAWSGGTLSSSSCGLDYVKTEFSLGVYSGAEPGPHRVERHPGQQVFKDGPQVMHWGQVRDTSYEEVELALFLLDRTGTLSFAMWRQKGERKDRTSLLPSGIKMVGNGRENPLTVTVPVFFLAGNRSWNGKDGRENEFDITGYRKRKLPIGNISITMGKYQLRSGTRHM